MAKEKREELVTPEFRVSFPEVFKPSTFGNGEPKYRIKMLFAAGLDLTPLKQLAQKAAIAKWGNDIPKALRSPFRKAEEFEYEGYEPGMLVIGAVTEMEPTIVDQARQPILRPEDFYAGCYARALVTAFGYDKQGNKGVSFGFTMIQKLRDGAPFVKRRKAEDVFDAVATGDGAPAAGAASGGDPLFT